MGCLSVNTKRIGGSCGAFSPYGGVASSFAVKGGITGAFAAVSGLCGCVRRKGGLKAAAGAVCGTSLGAGQNIIWASDGLMLTLEGGYLYYTVKEG